MIRQPYYVIGMLSIWIAAACSSTESGVNTAVGSGGTAGATSSANDLCQLGCVATLAAKCSNGPSDQATCEADCAALLAGTCATQYRALQTCAVGKAVTCGTTGIPVVAPCATEQTAFIACLN